LGYKNLLGETTNIKVTVVGVMKKSLMTEGEFHVDDTTLEEIASQQTGAAQAFAAIVKFKDADPTKEAEQKEAIAKTGNYTAISLKEQVAAVTNVVSAITTGLSLVGFIALFAASFGIINTLLMSVYERTQEIGLMKALGMHRRAVFSLFAFEAVLVGFWGSIVAVGAGFGVSQLINNWATTSFLKDFEGFTLLLVTPVNALSVVALIMTIAFLAGTLPALKASRLNPIDALRNE
jgi:putative ABC transport system permease protein